MTTPEHDRAAQAVGDLLTLVERELLDTAKSFASYFQTLVKEERTEELPDAIEAFAKELERNADLHEIIKEVNRSPMSDLSSLKFVMTANKGEMVDRIFSRHFDTYLAHLG